MFLTMACTSAILTWAHFQHRRQITAYVTAETSYLLSISQITHTRIPPNADRTQALSTYIKAMEDAGFRNVDVATPSGEVVASTNPGQVGKKINIKKPRMKAKQSPIRISAELKDVDLEVGVEQKPYEVQFPIVQGDKVIGYAQVRGATEAVDALLRQWYKERLYQVLTTMLAGLVALVYLAFRFTKPIDMLVEGAQQVARGNLDVSLPASGSDEMGRLAETFNHMIARLRESRELQERLNEAEKLSLLGRFAATVAHEVRNSLNFINLSIDQIRAKLMRSEEGAARELQRNLANIKDELGRLNRLVNDFLSAGRQAPPELASCDLGASVAQAVSLVEKQALRQQVSITEELPADLSPLRADAAQMKTCFVNILTNAIQAMPNGGRIRITAQRAQNPPSSLAACPTVRGERGEGGEMLVLHFSDTGPGIPLEDRERVFTPFYSTKTTGFGLGLAITKKIVEDHGGRIYVTDGKEAGANGQGVGTVVAIELPLPRVAPSPAPAVAGTPAA